MTPTDQQHLHATYCHLQQSNMPRECKAVLYQALKVYRALMELNTGTWDAKQWVDPFHKERSWSLTLQPTGRMESIP